MKRSRRDAESLWKKYLKDRAIATRNKLIEHYRPLVHMLAARLAQKLPAQISYDEICSAGYDGLMEAVQAYDPSHKAKFETFCQQRIHGAVMDWLRTLDGQSRTVRSFEKQRMYKKELLDSALGRPPTERELAEKMGITADRRPGGTSPTRPRSIPPSVFPSRCSPTISRAGSTARNGWCWCSITRRA